jgi:hypothetical protein
MEHTLFTTVDEMLDPDALSALGSVSVSSSRCIPLDTVEAYSGSTFYRIETNDQRGPRYVLKRMPSVVTGSNDNRHPSVTCWQHGLLDRLPSEIVQVTAACSHDGTGFALLMHDVHTELMPQSEHFTRVDNARFLDAMAAMHAAFWEDPQLNNPHLGLYSPCHLYPRFPLQTAQDAEGWTLLEQFIEPEVAQPIRALLRNPTALCDALSRYSSTLVHNDLWWANLGIRREPQAQVIMLDWDFATIGPPAVDLAFYLGENAAFLPITKDEVIEQYRKGFMQRLGSRFDDRWWLPQVELGSLGCFLRRGKWLLLGAFHATNDTERTQLIGELNWWSHHAQLGVQQL